MRTFFNCIITLSAVALHSSQAATIDPHTKLAKNNVTAFSSEIPTYDIPLLTEGEHKEYLLPFSDDYQSKNPWVQFQPSAFYDRSDVIAAKKTGTKPFLIAGVNCDQTITTSPTLTGVQWRYLSLRARGHVDHGQWGLFDKDKPEWKGISTVFSRVSGEGLLARKPEYLRHEDDNVENQKKAYGAMQELLTKDNRGVRNLGLTHQQIASPLLSAIEAYTQKDQSIVDIGGERFEISSKQMEGSVDFTNPDDKNFEENFQKLRRNQSGWTGRGVQGSPFNDEIFSNRIYTIKRLNPAPGQVPSITIDGITPHLIYRYGFYQGGTYRTEPSTIANFFGLKKNADSEVHWNHCN